MPVNADAMHIQDNSSRRGMEIHHDRMESERVHAENNIEGSRSPPNGSGSGAPPRAREQRRERSWYSEDVHRAWYSDISTDPTAAVRVRISRGRGTFCVHRSTYSKDVQQRRAAKTYSKDVQQRRTAKTYSEDVVQRRERYSSSEFAGRAPASPRVGRHLEDTVGVGEGWGAYHRWCRRAGPRTAYSHSTSLPGKRPNEAWRSITIEWSPSECMQKTT
jgi:hypothetical protein